MNYDTVSPGGGKEWGGGGGQRDAYSIMDLLTKGLLINLLNIFYGKVARGT